MSAWIDTFVDEVAGSLGSGDEGDAMLAVSAMIGALLLSRVQVDRPKSDRMLKAVRDRLTRLEHAASRGAPA